MLQLEHHMHFAGASGNDVSQLVTVQEKGLSVKELELSTVSHTQAQYISKSGKDRFTVFTFTCKLCSFMIPCGKKLMIHVHVTLKWYNE